MIYKCLKDMNFLKGIAELLIYAHISAFHVSVDVDHESLANLS